MQPRGFTNPPPGFNMSDGKQAPQNIQDAFLNTVRREKTSVVVYLLNGAKLTGRIRSFDKFSVLLESGSQEQLIFKHAISTISQSRRGTGELHSQATTETNPRDMRDSDVPEA
jgi:host factor-I protein